MISKIATIEMGVCTDFASQVAPIPKNRKRKFIP